MQTVSICQCFKMPTAEKGKWENVLWSQLSDLLKYDPKRKQSLQCCVSRGERHFFNTWHACDISAMFLKTNLLTLCVKYHTIYFIYCVFMWHLLLFQLWEQVYYHFLKLNPLSSNSKLMMRMMYLSGTWKWVTLNQRALCSCLHVPSFAISLFAGKLSVKHILLKHPETLVSYTSHIISIFMTIWATPC